MICIIILNDHINWPPGRYQVFYFFRCKRSESVCNTGASERSEARLGYYEGDLITLPYYLKVIHLP